MATGTAAAIAGIVAQINPLIAIAVQAFAAARAIRDAAKAANPTVIVDKTTGTVYATEQEALNAGVLPENISSSLPSDAELIKTLFDNAGLLKGEAAEMRAWLATLIPPPVPPTPVPPV